MEAPAAVQAAFSPPHVFVGFATAEEIEFVVVFGEGLFDGVTDQERAGADGGEFGIKTGQVMKRAAMAGKRVKARDNTTINA